MRLKLVLLRAADKFLSFYIPFLAITSGAGIVITLAVVLYVFISGPA